MLSLSIEFLKFIIYSSLIVVISKYILVKILRNLADNLNLKPKTTGAVAGYATSVPELLTIGASTFNGLIGASIYNILSSNIINLIQYIVSIFLHKNISKLKNRAIKSDILLIIITILIPILILNFNINLNISIVPIFIITYLLFILINSKTHKLYLTNEILETEERNKSIGNKKKIIIYIIELITIGLILFIIGDRLGTVLEQLCKNFNVSESIIGILLGFITSLPELITFFESQKYHKDNSDEDIFGVVEATNNLFTSNILNLFVIQSIGIFMHTIIF